MTNFDYYPETKSMCSLLVDPSCTVNLSSAALTSPEFMGFVVVVGSLFTTHTKSLCRRAKISYGMKCLRKRKIGLNYWTIPYSVMF